MIYLLLFYILLTIICNVYNKYFQQWMMTKHGIATHKTVYQFFEKPLRILVITFALILYYHTACSVMQ